MFAEVQSTFEQYKLQWCKLVGVCADNAPSMVGARKGIIEILKERATAMNVQKCDIIILHSIIYQQNLCSKYIRLKNVIDVIVDTIHFIRSRGLNHRQFKAFLDELSSEHDDTMMWHIIAM